MKVSNLTKIYKLYKKPSDRLKELIDRKKRHTLFFANKDISFELKTKETLGIIGLNGAGKSTLLKQIAGVIDPTSGTIEKNGRVTALLELGTGFNPELSGEENIYFNAMLLGMTKEQIDQKKKQIIDFSELGNFIYEPLKTYSSGMMMRLAFSIAIHTDPSILIVDEALSVGDAYFSAKCTQALRDLKRKDLSILYVSHDLNSLKILCDRLILLHRGQILKQGSPKEVIDYYNYLIASMHNQSDIEFSSDGYGRLSAKIVSVKVQGIESKGHVLSSGEIGEVEIKIQAYEDIRDVTLGFLIRDRFGQDIFGTNTYHHDISLSLNAGEVRTVKISMPFNIAPGHYTVTAALHKGASHTQGCIHWIDNACEFQVAGYQGKFFVGLCRLEPTFEVYS